MTVAELIDILKSHNPEAVVMRGVPDRDGEDDSREVIRIDQCTIPGDTVSVTLW